MKEVKTKKHFNIFGFIVVLLILYLVLSFGYYILSLPIKNIYISGNTYLSDAIIIEDAGLKKYPSMIKVSKSKISKKLLKNNMIESVEISKKLNGIIKINIEESKPIFLNRNTNEIVLLNGKNLNKDINITHLPQLINNVPTDLYKSLIKSFNYVDYTILMNVSEIEYSPDIINEKTIDNERFYLRMNDGNSVYINPVNIKRLNNYFEVYDRLPDGKKGTLYFDSNSTNNLFKAYGEKKTSEVDVNELPS